MKTPLHKCRTAEGITLEQLAAALGTSSATLSRLEHGSTRTSGAICYKVIERYKHMGLSLDHLINAHLHPDFVVIEYARSGCNETSELGRKVVAAGC